ncbi:hypothetical protein ACFVGY_33060 [Streptomyces sp. NPDC127106]|uniref:hypothetical protein n=1 Tax=Streptomyces sp. NPDC127106 TaxID=3345360 RepID=UPI00362A4BE7
MDPISVAVLVALAGGAGGEVGKQAWAGLSALVRRPFRRGQGESPEAPVVGSGEAELARLEQAPDDPTRAQALSDTLAARAAADPDFSAGLQQWWHEQVKLVRTGDGDVDNEISGGTFHGQVLQGRDYSNISFSTPPPPPPTPGTSTPPEQG